MIRAAFLLIFIFIQSISLKAFAIGPQDIETYTVQIPKVILINGIGPVYPHEISGIPTPASVSFSRLVAGSYDGSNWELTTDRPIGISISYNTNGFIEPKFVIISKDNGFTVSDTRVYPTKIVFYTNPTSGSTNRIFKFYPIIKVSQDIPPGSYTGKITFTVLEL